MRYDFDAKGDRAYRWHLPTTSRAAQLATSAGAIQMPGSHKEAPVDL
jgi:hypothetical protein